MEGLAVGVVGASGLAGGEIVDLLLARGVAAERLRLLGSLRTAGREIRREGLSATVQLVGPAALEGLDVVFFAAGPAVSGEHAAAAVSAGAAVIDLTSRFRLDPSVPLVVPEVNPAALAGFRERGIAASPSGTAVALTTVLAPLAAGAGLRRIVVSTYQGASGAGGRAVRRLLGETVDLLNSRAEAGTASRLAFNCLPQVGELLPGGATAHEVQVVEETRRVLDDPGLALSVSAARVPVFFGVALDLHLETEQRLSAVEAAEILRAAPGVLVHDVAAGSCPTPAGTVGSDATHVGRLRDDPAVEHGLALWVTQDVVHRGAALNAVGIAEVLAREHL